MQALVVACAALLCAGGRILEPLRGSQAAFEAAGVTYLSGCEANLEGKTGASILKGDLCNVGGGGFLR